MEYGNVRANSEIKQDGGIRALAPTKQMDDDGGGDVDHVLQRKLIPVLRLLGIHQRRTPLRPRDVRHSGILQGARRERGNHIGAALRHLARVGSVPTRCVPSKRRIPDGILVRVRIDPTPT